MNKKNYIQLVKVAKAYDDGYVAVKDININITQGEFVTLLGPSGCGKTTILKMLAGFEQPTSGKIIVDELDIKNLPVNQRPTATVFQDYALFPNMNVFENIAYGLKVMRKPLRNISDKVKERQEKIYRDAIKKAANEIKKIKNQQIELLREIVKIESQYAIHPEVMNIKDIRHLQYTTKNEYLLTRLRREQGDNANFKISFNMRWKEFLQKINRVIFKQYRPLSYRKRNMNKWEILFFELRKWYLYKLPLDNKIDKLNYEYNDFDQWISYWENYPGTTTEAFEKKNTTIRLSKDEITRRASKIIEMVGLNGSEAKYPVDLSGGMQQRVALARALVVEPKIVLLDEPLSALDAKVRQQMQSELKRIHNELKLTFILVTHDQEEALTLSNKVVVMSKGRIEQIDTPKRIYDNPRNEWVASFIGRANIFDAIYIDNDRIEFMKEVFKISHDVAKRFKQNTKIKFVIRPEDITIVSPQRGTIVGRVTQVVYRGLMYDIKCVWKKQDILVQSLNAPHINDLVGLKWTAKSIHVMLDRIKRNPNEFRI